MPDDAPLRRWAALLYPAPRPRLLDHAAVPARARTVTHGRQRRVIGPVGATSSPHPADRPRPDDRVRVLGRTWGRAKPGRQATWA